MCWSSGWSWSGNPITPPFSSSYPIESPRDSDDDLIVRHSHQDPLRCAARVCVCVFTKCVYCARWWWWWWPPSPRVSLPPQCVSPRSRPNTFLQLTFLQDLTYSPASRSCMWLLTGGSPTQPGIHSPGSGVCGIERERERECGIAGAPALGPTGG